jgi:hypothetical protein
MQIEESVGASFAAEISRLSRCDALLFFSGLGRILSPRNKSEMIVFEANKKLLQVLKRHDTQKRFKIVCDGFKIESS